MDRLFYEPNRSQRVVATPVIVAHRAHLSHYISQLTALEREQRRIALEQQLLRRTQVQLAAKRNQLTYLIAEEQDLVLRAVQQQQEQRRAEDEAVIAVALAEREAQIARRQKLRQAVFRKQQEEQAQKDKEIQRVLRLVQAHNRSQEQEQEQEERHVSPFDAIEQLRQFRQQSELMPSSSDPDTSNHEESVYRPGSISHFLRQQGIKPNNVYSPTYLAPQNVNKRGSRRGNVQDRQFQQRIKESAESSMLVPDVNYASAQDFLSALLGGPEGVKREAEELAPQSKDSAQKDNYAEILPPDDGKMPLEDLAKILFGEQQPAAVSTKTSSTRSVPTKVSIPSKPSFQYTLSSSAVPKISSEARQSPSAFEAIAKQIAALRAKVDTSTSRINDILEDSDLDETKRRQLLLEIQLQLEKYYCDLDDIVTGSDADNESPEIKDMRLQLRLQKHAVTTAAVDAADRIDKILSPESPSDSEGDDIASHEEGSSTDDFAEVKSELHIESAIAERVENPRQIDGDPEFQLEEPVLAVVDGSEVLMPEPPKQKNENAIVNMTTTSPKELEPTDAGEAILENDEFFVVEKPGIVERALEENDETLDREEKSEVKIPLILTPVQSTTLLADVSEERASVASDFVPTETEDFSENGPKYEDNNDDDTSVIVTSEVPVIHEQKADEKFVPESSDHAGHVILETNTGEEKDEFLEDEEVDERKTPLTLPSENTLSVKKPKPSRSPSPARHVMIENVPEDE
ncbi:hypothetical protein V1512DRAFT_255666 [Lipomyces arxii]|uniref:uncharacterized protein n=1 Tax=Lipomyces arxii TaxID=56418 RepID=UPI0034CFEEC3